MPPLSSDACILVCNRLPVPVSLKCILPPEAAVEDNDGLFVESLKAPDTVIPAFTRQEVYFDSRLAKKRKLQVSGSCQADLTEYWQRRLDRQLNESLGRSGEDDEDDDEGTLIGSVDHEKASEKGGAGKSSTQRTVAGSPSSSQSSLDDTFSIRSIDLSLETRTVPRGRFTDLEATTATTSASSKHNQRWKTLQTPPRCHFRAIQSLPSFPSGSSKKKPPTLQLLLYPKRPRSSFLSTIPDSTPLSALTLPGTHETFARFGWPISQCQEVASTISNQLIDGIRFMDWRVTPKGEKGRERLLGYHGATNQRIELGDAIREVIEWLEGDGKDDTIVISLKQEKGDGALMKRLLFDLYIEPTRSKWFLEPKIPTLGEARGKIVLFSRFGAADEDKVGGIHPPIWPDNHKGVFDYTLPLSAQRVYTQDWYHIPSTSAIPTKYELALDLLGQAGSNPLDLGLNFTSGGSVPWAFPYLIAKGFREEPRKIMACLSRRGMNSLMRDWVATLLFNTPKKAASSSTRNEVGPTYAATPGLQATFAIDFYDWVNASDLVPLLIEANFTEEEVKVEPLYDINEDDEQEDDYEDDDDDLEEEEDDDK